MADITIGPRQIIASRSATRKPIDMALMPKACSGFSILPSTSGLVSRPSRRGSDGPYTSASRIPIFQPSEARDRARLTAVVDLPTPPLPEATATMRSMPGMARLRGAAGRGCAPKAGACECPAGP